MSAWGSGGDNGGPSGNGPWGRPSGSNDPQGKRPSNPKPQGEPQGPEFDEWFRKGHEQFRKAFGGGPSNGMGGGNDFFSDPRRTFFVLLGALIAIWLASGIYFVKADEQGVVMRFGQFHRVTPPGVNYHMPYPFEAALTPKVTVVNKVEVGFRGANARNARPADGMADESLMLTGDENIVDITFEVQWRILNAPDFLFNVRDPEETVRAVAESAMREVVGKTPIATILAEGKLQVEQSTKKLIQETLQEYHSGVEIVSVNLLRADPPQQVIDAFRDVQTARADLETARNQAEAYRNDILPRARGQAEQMLQEAEAYKQEVVSRAKGEAARFSSVWAEYKNAKDATRKRMYLETMEDVLQGMHKVIVDDKNGHGVLPFLPLNDLRPREEKPAEKPEKGVTP